MVNFNPAKLQTTFVSPATRTHPIIGRKYTLTHSDESGNLFLSVGTQFDYSSINVKNRDEVFAEWIHERGKIYFVGKVYVTGGEFTDEIAKRRFMIFQKEMPLALTAIFYGDRFLLSNYPYLLYAPIYIQFQSSLPQYHRTIYFGNPRAYLV